VLRVPSDNGYPSTLSSGTLADRHFGGTIAAADLVVATAVGGE
jgi:hypothetical protein